MPLNIDDSKLEKLQGMESGERLKFINGLAPEDRTQLVGAVKEWKARSAGPSRSGPMAPGVPSIPTSVPVREPGGQPAEFMPPGAEASVREGAAAAADSSGFKQPTRVIDRTAEDFAAMAPKPAPAPAPEPGILDRIDAWGQKLFQGPTAEQQAAYRQQKDPATFAEEQRRAKVLKESALSPEEQGRFVAAEGKKDFADLSGEGWSGVAGFEPGGPLATLDPEAAKALREHVTEAKTSKVKLGPAELGGHSALGTLSSEIPTFGLPMVEGTTVAKKVPGAVGRALQAGVNAVPTMAAIGGVKGYTEDQSVAGAARGAAEGAVGGLLGGTILHGAGEAAGALWRAGAKALAAKPSAGSYPRPEVKAPDILERISKGRATEAQAGLELPTEAAGRAEPQVVAVVSNDAMQQFANEMEAKAATADTVMRRSGTVVMSPEELKAANRRGGTVSMRGENAPPRITAAKPEPVAAPPPELPKTGAPTWATAMVDDAGQPVVVAVWQHADGRTAQTVHPVASPADAAKLKAKYGDALIISENLGARYPDLIEPLMRSRTPEDVIRTRGNALAKDRPQNVSGTQSMSIRELEDAGAMAPSGDRTGVKPVPVSDYTEMPKPDSHSIFVMPNGMLKIEAQRAAQARLPEERSVVAYHGTPHKFDEFTMSAIGTGEGAQLYGHGLYFAEKKSIAEWYQKELSTPNPHEPLPEDRLVEYFAPGKLVQGHNGIDRVVAFHPSGSLEGRSGWVVDVIRVKPDGSPMPGERVRHHFTHPTIGEYQDIMALRGEPSTLQPTEGYLKTVKLPSKDTFLDWDQPTFMQPPEILRKVEAAVKTHGVEMDEYPYEMTGEDIYWAMANHFGGPEEASAALKEAGIPGLKYLNNESRAGKNPTPEHNFVVWDKGAIRYPEKEAARLAEGPPPGMGEQTYAGIRAQQRLEDVAGQGKGGAPNEPPFVPEVPGAQQPKEKPKAEVRIATGGAAKEVLAVPPSVGKAVPADYSKTMDEAVALYRKSLPQATAMQKLHEGIVGNHLRGPADVAALKTSIQASAMLQRSSDDLWQSLQRRLKLDQVKGLDKDLDKLFRSAHADREKVLTELSTTHGRLVDDAKDFLRSMMLERDQNEKTLAAMGVIPDKWANLQDARLLDAYLTRRYLAYAMPPGAWAERLKTPATEDILREGIDFFAQEALKKGKQVDKTALVQAVQEAANAPNMLEAMKGNKTFAPFKALLERKDIPGPVRRLMGEIESGSMNMSMSLGTQRALISRISLLNEVALNPEWASPKMDIAKGFEYRLPDSPAMGNARNMYVTKDVFDALGNAHKAGAATHRLISEVVGLVKGNQMMSMGPVMNSFFGNLWSGTLAGGLDITRPLKSGKYLYQAFRAMRDYAKDPTGQTGLGGLVLEARRTGADYFGFGHEEIGSPTGRKWLKAMESVFPVGEAPDLITAMGRIAKKGFDLYRDVQAKHGALLDHPDRMFRLQSYLLLRDKFLADLADSGAKARVVTEGILNTDPALAQSAAQKLRANTKSGDAATERAVMEAVTRLAARRVNQSFWNPTTIGPALDKLRKGGAGVLAPYLTAAFEAPRVNLMALQRMGLGSGGGPVEHDLTLRLLLTSGVIGAIAGAGGALRDRFGISDAQLAEANNQRSNQSMAFRPVEFWLPFPDSKGRAQAWNLTPLFDLFRYLVGRPDAPLFTKVMRPFTNAALSPFEGGAAEGPLRAGAASLGLADPGFQGQAPDTTTPTTQAMLEFALKNSLLPGYVRNTVDALTRADVLPGRKPWQEPLTGPQAALSAAGIKNIQPVSVGRGSPSAMSKALEFKGEMDTLKKKAASIERSSDPNGGHRSDAPSGVKRVAEEMQRKAKLFVQKKDK